MSKNLFPPNGGNPLSSPGLKPGTAPGLPKGRASRGLLVMPCHDLKNCAHRAARWPQPENWLIAGQDLLDQWIRLGTPARVGYHTGSRQLERAIGFGELRTALENGQVIHRHIDSKTHQEHLLILAWLRVSRKSWQPVHVSLLITQDGTDVFIKTVYDPRSYDWMWTDQYTRRICWCK